MAEPQRLYPWTLTQLRTPHTSSVPYPPYIDPNPINGRHWAARQLVRAFRGLVGHRWVAWKTAALVLYEMAIEILSAWPIEQEMSEEDAFPTTDAVEFLEEQLPYFHGILEGEHEPTRLEREGLLRAINTRRWDHPDIEIEEDHVIRSAYWAAWILLATPSSSIEQPVNDLGAGLWRLFVAVNDTWGREAAYEMYRVWWERTFSRLAFIQEDEPEYDEEEDA